MSDLALPKSKEIDSQISILESLNEKNEKYIESLKQVIEQLKNQIQFEQERNQKLVKDNSQIKSDNSIKNKRIEILEKILQDNDVPLNQQLLKQESLQAQLNTDQKIRLAQMRQTLSDQKEDSQDEVSSQTNIELNLTISQSSSSPTKLPSISDPLGDVIPITENSILNIGVPTKYSSAFSQEQGLEFYQAASKVIVAHGYDTEANPDPTSQQPHENSPLSNRILQPPILSGRLLDIGGEEKKQRNSLENNKVNFFMRSSSLMLQQAGTDISFISPFTPKIPPASTSNKSENSNTNSNGTPLQQFDFNNAFEENKDGSLQEIANNEEMLIKDIKSNSINESSPAENFERQGSIKLASSSPVLNGQNVSISSPPKQPAIDLPKKKYKLFEQFYMVGCTRQELQSDQWENDTNPELNIVVPSKLLYSYPKDNDVPELEYQKRIMAKNKLNQILLIKGTIGNSFTSSLSPSVQSVHE